MTLFDMALRNVKRNFYNYFLYLFSMVFAITIYFIFTSIQYNDQVLKLTEESLRIAVSFKTSSVVIGVFAAMFIWYSNSFFIKKRKKEVALYSLLGVKKRQIGRMLFYENALMGIIALGGGILIGGLLSKLFIMLLMRLMGFSVPIRFSIEPKAILNTVIAYAIIFAIASIHSYSLIYRFKLIELFKAEKTGEKEPKASIFFAIISIILIGGGYFTYVKYQTILETLIAVIIGTYMFFSSFTLYVVKALKKNKRRYYMGINMIGTSQLLYRIKSNARTLATIAVLSATTLTAMEVVSSIYYDFQTKLNSKYPFSYAYVSSGKELDIKVEEIMSKYPRNKIIGTADANLIAATGRCPDIYKLERLKERNNKDTNVDIISETNYNNIVKIRGIDEKINLPDEKSIVVIDEGYSNAIMNSYIDKSFILNSKEGTNKKEEFKVIDFKTEPLVNRLMADEIIVVKDSVYERYYSPQNAYRIRGYINSNAKNSEELTKAMSSIMGPILKDKSHTNFSYSVYYNQYKEGLMESGMTLFIGMFLGLVFLICTGSIIFFKQLSEANYDKENYNILKNIGVSRKEIKTSISKQIFIIFMLPLVVGVVHSLVANTLMTKVFNTNFTVPVLISIAAYTIIYMIYYILTVNSYSTIVNS